MVSQDGDITERTSDSFLVGRDGRKRTMLGPTSSSSEDFQGELAISSETESLKSLKHLCWEKGKNQRAETVSYVDSRTEILINSSGSLTSRDLSFFGLSITVLDELEEFPHEEVSAS